jgi:hypothetical protein
MRIPDQQKQRWEYLRKKVGAAIRGFGGRVLFFCVLIVGVVCGTIGILLCLSPFLLYGAVLVLIAVGGFKVCTILPGYVEQADRDRAIPYIPPVIADLLPAKEVLVRGSQEPSQDQSTMLLRATGDGAEVSSDELLRASIGEVNWK